jgi:phage tail tape-measure protein
MQLAPLELAHEEWLEPAAWAMARSEVLGAMVGSRVGAAETGALLVVDTVVGDIVGFLLVVGGVSVGAVVAGSRVGD